MNVPTRLKFGRLKGRIKEWVKRKPSHSQHQSSASLPLPAVQSATPVPAPTGNLGQNPSAHRLSDPNLPTSGSQTTSPQAQAISAPGTPTSVGPAAHIGSTSVTGPATNQTPISNVNSNTAPTRWAGLERFASVLASVSNTIGPLRAIVNELIECVNIYEMAAKDKDEYKALQTELEQLFTELQAQFADDTTPSATGSNVDPTTESLCKCIQDELEAVKAKQGSGGFKQHLRAGNAQDDVLTCYRRVHGHLIRLSVYMSSSAKKDLEKRAIALQKQAENANSDRVLARLDRLRPSLSACYDSAQAAELQRGECTPGTRMDALARMHSHASDPRSGAVFWLNGMAGTGKTTIAYTFCTELNSKRHLAASFFCSRLLPECRDVNLIVPSIAYQLARYSQPFRSALVKVLEADPDIPTRSLKIQFGDLIAEPLLTMQRNNTLPANLVVMIDALDECENKECTRIMLEILLANSSSLPIKFFVSSRPEPEIRHEMTKRLGGDQSSRLVLHELDRSIVRADIEKYLRTALSQLDLSDGEFTLLARDAGVLFIYAATVVRYISYRNFNQNPRGRLQTVLNASGPGVKQQNRAIDDLYAAIIKGPLEDEGLDDVERNDILQVLHTIVCAQEPLTVETLSGLLQFGSVDRARAAIQPLWSVLHITGASELVTTLHASFPDYIFNEARSGRYHCNSKAHNHRLSRLCFDKIQAAPSFNICNLKSSFVRDKKVVDLDSRVMKAISPDLFYACRYWGAHVNGADGSTDLSGMVSSFLSTRLLLWLEVMNLKNSIQIAVDVMKQRQPHSEELTELADDARCFTTTFASTPVSQSTPHLYLSMLPFWPQSRPVSRVYTKAFLGLPGVEGTAVNRRQLALLAAWSFSNILELDSILFDSVKSATFSPDGRRVAFATYNRILVIDSLTGRQLSRPLRGHVHPVLSAAYSSDGTRIISCSVSRIQVQDAESGKDIAITNIGGSRTGTSVQLSPDSARIISAESRFIYVWDSHSGDEVLGRLEGHTDKINIVAYSPDGKYIVSGACDKTLRIWDAQTGRVVMVVGPLAGQNSSVLSIGYSPSGTRIAFGLADGTIGVCCSLNKDLVLGPIEGHTEAITSVVYSPSGKHIASGSEDKTIRVWDSQSGDMILGPLEAHTGGVLSVAYSPDGSEIVSSSYDKTIRMWDARIKGLILTPLECHTGVVTSVGYSPDGARIYSGSEDKTINIWDAESGDLVLGPLKGHTDWVESVCYSPNGIHIASGSRDKTVRVWDTQNGATVLGPLAGHTKPITSICYSPDGAYIASGSKDATICVWDTQSGSMILGPLEPEGHTKLSWVVSVKYSPSGDYLISTSSSNQKDLGIQIWDVRSGDTALVAKYGKKITSIEYSPDGTCFIFGSTDNTIRVCNSQSGDIIRLIGARAPGAKDFKLHTVISVKYSPTGTYIASGSTDRAIRVWDAQSGNLLFDPLAGHTDQVNSVSYSPDGNFIASGSSDATIRVWNVRNQSNSHSADISTHANWEINPDGWVTKSKNRSQTLLWVPYDMRRSLVRSVANALVISRNGSIRLNFDHAYIGESWAKCYIPIALP
ncbi:unnamed protein product [Rhizoctonia solani]|uniref:Nephrocystin 3-like N-terminal domain-containing protein n=1 Tax=Rhizoctonia solani TaxID=456999 RepID=A0A8H3D7J3_9AGAM|nr:unnamed protein product [Rhizoctonia solani]